MDFRAMLMKRKKPAKKVVVVSARHVCGFGAELAKSVRQAGTLLNGAGGVDSMARPFGLCHIAIGHITDTVHGFVP